jgi:hypothetical protein
MPVLDVHSTYLVYSGESGSSSSNPARRYADWTRHIVSESVQNPTVEDFDLLPGETRQVFSGTRSTSINGTTEFDLSLHTTESSVYRMTHSGGTAPAFRTSRGLALNGEELTLTINNNATAVLELDALSAQSFSAVQVGDTVFLPGSTTGDTASVFNANNEGFWLVLARATKSLTLRRRVGESFIGVAEVVTLTDDDQLQVYSAAGVQIGDSMDVSAGFSALTQKVFVVSEVTADWIQFTSTESLPLESGIIPTASGLSFYTEAKRFVRVEVDQEAVLRFNGDTSSSIRLSPRTPGDQEQIAHFEAWGSFWSLTVVNRSSAATLKVNLFTVE